MLSVTDLSSYLYCARKLFLSRIIKVPIKRDVMLKGLIKHEVMEKANKSEKQIIESITKQQPLTELQETYQKHYANAFLKTTEDYARDLQRFNIDKKEFFQQNLKIFTLEASERASNVLSFINKTNLYSADLWNSLEPKILVEQKLSSPNLMLCGKVDKIEVYNDRIIPIELKSGKAPNTGVWPSNKIQLIAYCLLVKERFNKQVSEGILHYIDSNEKRPVVLNPFSETELFSIRDKTIKVLESKTPPEIVQSNKCNSCELKEQCHNLK